MTPVGGKWIVLAKGMQAGSSEENEEALRQQFADARESAEQRASFGACSSSSTPPKPTHFTVTLAASTGPYEGKQFKVEPRTKHTKVHEVKIGRAKTKQFRTKGMSLPKDDEVSTTHAKVVVKDGAVHYVDVGSSNGSWLDSGEGEVELDEGDHHRLETGHVLRIGSSTFSITVEPNY